MHIEDLVFIITGGAGGLGAQVARSIIAKGGLVALFDIDEKRLDEVVKECSNDVCYSPGPIDITSESQVEEAINKTRNYFSNKVLAGAILCGGILFPPASKLGYGPKNVLTSYEQFKHVLNVNVLGTYCVAQKVSEVFIKNKPLNKDGERGIIITLSSILGLDGVIVGYGTSKAAVAGLTLPLATELSPFGIRVMSIAPGAFDTPMTHGPIKPPSAVFPHRVGQPEEVADLVLGIIQMPMLNGTVIRLDGAYRSNL